jgi:acetyl-CoA synthetase
VARASTAIGVSPIIKEIVQKQAHSTRLTLKEVIECSVISISDNLEGGKIFLFAVVKFNKNISKKIEENIISNFGTFALPKKIIIVKELPKTRSGKIVRRLLRSIANYEDEKNYGDLSTLSNKYVVSHLTETFKNA